MIYAYRSDHPLTWSVDQLRRRRFRQLIVPAGPVENRRVSQGLVRHGHDEIGRAVVDVLVLSVDGPSVVMRALTVNDRGSPLAIAGPIEVYELLRSDYAVDRMLELTDPAVHS